MTILMEWKDAEEVESCNGTTTHPYQIMPNSPHSTTVMKIPAALPEARWMRPDSVSDHAMPTM